MANVVQSMSEWFWSEKFWLLPNTTWTDLESDEITRLPSARDMFIPLPLGFALFLVRLLWERIVARPIGRWYKLRETTTRKPQPNVLLESTFKSNRKILPSHEILVELAKKTDLTTRQIERWWRLRKTVGKPSELQRFCETTWRFLFYLSSFSYGMCILWNKPWFWDTKHCWYNYPRQHVSDDMWWYYMIELAFYWSLIYSLCIDNKRKDFMENIIHHIATISLMVFSWTDNFVRVGTLVLVVHDAVDYWLEGAKIAKYLRYPTLCDALFVVFTIIWIITRMILYPTRILHSTLNEGHHILGMLPAYYVFNILLCVLQALHIFWFSIICRMFYQYIVKGEIEKDGRSETDPDEEDEAADLVSNGSHHKSANGKHSSNNNISPTKMLSSNGISGNAKEHRNGNIPGSTVKERDT